MTDAITRCPKCHTSFRLNSDLLNSAKGSVRCGSCLTIFNAKENLLHAQRALASSDTQPSAKEVSPPAASPAETPPQESENELINDDTPSSSHEGDTSPRPAEFDENVFVAHHASKSEINLFERRIKEENNRELENADPDESWALSLLDDEDEDGAPKSRDTDNEKRKIAKQKPLFQIIEEHEANDTSVDNSTPAHTVTSTEHNDEADEDYEHDSMYPQSRTDFLDAIEPEPLEITAPESEPFWQSNTFWLGLSALAALLLTYQLAAFNFNEFSRKPNLRPYYHQACSILGCTLPSLQNLDQIRVQNMVVMNHPHAENMLLVDATLLNQASFAQGFPTLQLIFTDMNNELVSKMQFPPETYVGGELSGAKTMPAQHPIHITLEITDPGTHAVNYQIGIVKP